MHAPIHIIYITYLYIVDFFGLLTEKTRASSRTKRTRHVFFWKNGSLICSWSWTQQPKTLQNRDSNETIYNVHITKMTQKIAWTCLVVGEWHYSSLKPWWELSQVSQRKKTRDSPPTLGYISPKGIVSGTPTWLKESGTVNFYMDTPLRFSMVHLKISPWKKRFRTWKLSCSGSMLNI